MITSISQNAGKNCVVPTWLGNFERYQIETARERNLSISNYVGFRGYMDDELHTKKR